jgi:hypothetical protein
MTHESPAELKWRECLIGTSAMLTTVASSTTINWQVTMMAKAMVEDRFWA